MCSGMGERSAKHKRNKKLIPLCRSLARSLWRSAREYHGWLLSRLFEMSVDQTNVVDIIGKTPTGEITLTISDHLDWTETADHLLTLQEKLNTYLRFLESGEVYERYPDALGRVLIINVVFKFAPNLEARSFLTKAKSIIEGAGFRFQFELFSASP